ncbi:MAG: hypothetical protein WC317_07345 [Candidatus Omnitrophota bacterium]|jgi:hypothetical protein
MADSFDSLIERAKREANGDFLSSTDIQLRGMKLMTESIDRFNTESGKLSGNMIKIYWLQVALIVIQIAIVLGQIFKWW